MAVLFLLALILICWQALRLKPVWPPAYESGTRVGEQVQPVAVPSWRTPPNLPRKLPERLLFLDERASNWPGMENQGAECRVFVRFSSQHWVERPASAAGVQRWLGEQGRGAAKPWRLLHFPLAAFLDDDDGDGDPLDAGELRAALPGAEVEVFCGEVARTPEGFQ